MEQGNKPASIDQKCRKGREENREGPWPWTTKLIISMVICSVACHFRINSARGRVCTRHVFPRTRTVGTVNASSRYCNPLPPSFAAFREGENFSAGAESSGRIIPCTWDVSYTLRGWNKFSGTCGPESTGIFIYQNVQFRIYKDRYWECMREKGKLKNFQGWNWIIHHL